MIVQVNLKNLSDSNCSLGLSILVLKLTWNDAEKHTHFIWIGWAQDYQTEVGEKVNENKNTRNVYGPYTLPIWENAC